MEREHKKPYVSCIRINGKPILPPIITPEIHKELNFYKQQAIKLETRLKNCRTLKKNLDELLKLQPLTDRPISQLTFGDNSHIEALGIDNTLNSSCKAPLKVSKKGFLKKDVIEVTEYTDNTVKVIIDHQGVEESNTNKACDNSESNESNFNDPANNTIPEIEKESSTERSIEDSIQSEALSEERMKPHLIRSNSYTLEAPSPILLAHLCKNAMDPPLRAWCSVEDNSTPSSSEEFNSINTVFNQNLKKEDNIQHSNYAETNSTPLINTDLNIDSSLGKNTPSIEVFQTDISVQQITVNTHRNIGDSKNSDENTTFFLKNPVDIFQSDNEFMKVLKDIPDNYAEQIIELLKKQHLEKQERLKRYDSISPKTESIAKKQIIENAECLNSLEKNTDEGINCEIEDICELSDRSRESINSRPSELLSFIEENNITCKNVNNNSTYHVEDLSKSEYESQNPALEPLCIKQDNRIRRSSTFSMSPSQSIYYSLSDSSNTITPLCTPNTKQIDFENYEEGRSRIASSNISNKSQESRIYNKENDKFCENLMLQCSPSVSVNRELFPTSKIDENTMNAIRRDWAASVICAYAKGFLTRRLLRTERVQSIIETIKDALVCALELHKAESIDENDVELHRRLIQQVSAACYAFHEIFFDLSSSERMQIISLDRQRKLERAKRPQSGARSIRSNKSNRSLRSASSSRLSNTSASSIKSKIHTQRQSQSLTKV